MTGINKLFNAAGLLGAATVIAWMGYETYLQETQPKASTAVVAQVHGEGKKPVSCDMTQLLVDYHGEQKSYDVKALISLDAEGLVHETSKRIRHSKVMPMVELIKDYTDARTVEFRSCDADTGTLVSVDTLQQDPFNYLLSFNNTRRARVIVYNMRGKRAKYVTKVKNLHQIIIHTDS